ncbi:YfiR family protein [Roseateles sp.]|jgi:hypothetical protein|uniref:YfiR family protein n=1 Tax=Roseateles sp. TaxID=1971397 RepID=UPI0037C627B3
MKPGLTARCLLCLVRLLLGAAVGLGTGMSAFATPQEAQLKAAFIYRFAQYTDWPPPPMREFNYCLVGAGPLQSALQEVSAKPLAGAPAQLRVIQSPRQAEDCQVLVLVDMDRLSWQRWISSLKDEPVLLIGDSPDAYRAGAVFTLVLEPNGLAFRVNNSEARRRGLVLSSQVLKLAREVR